MKKNINPLINVLQIISVPFGAWILFVLFSSIAQWSYDRRNHPQESVQDKKELDEMRVYHYHKGLVEVDTNGYITIKKP